MKKNGFSFFIWSGVLFDDMNIAFQLFNHTHYNIIHLFPFHLRFSIHLKP
jgi:hypothetical protein